MKLIYKADSIIERDALLAHLAENDIVAESPRRDISRKMTNNTIDLSYGEYSVFFDGFSIYVRDDQEHEGRQQLISFLNRTNPEKLLGSRKSRAELDIRSLLIIIGVLIFIFYGFMNNILNE